jgi:hypothetical protein
MQSSARSVFDYTSSPSDTDNQLVIPIDELRTLVVNSSEISETTYAATTQWLHFKSALDNAKQLVESTHLLTDFKLWHQIFRNAESCCEVKKVSQPDVVKTFSTGLNDGWREIRESYASIISHRSEAYEDHPEIPLTFQLFADAVNYHAQLVYKPFVKDKVGDVGTDQIIADHVKSLDRIISKRRVAFWCGCFGMFGGKLKEKDKLRNEASQMFILKESVVAFSSGSGGR